jgi:hypothetical protein
LCSFVLDISYFDNKDLVFVDFAERIINEDAFLNIEREKFCIYNLLLSDYYLNMKSGYKLVKDSVYAAKECTDYDAYQTKVFFALIKKCKDFEMAENFLDDFKDELMMSDYLDLLCDFMQEKGEWEEALKVMNHKNFIMSNNAVVSKSYIYLRLEKHDELFDFCKEYINSNKIDSHTKSVLVINAAAAKRKKSTVESIKSEIQKVISKADGAFINLGCYCLLEDSIQIKRLIKQAFNSNLTNYYSLENWVILDKEYLEPYNELFLD